VQSANQKMEIKARKVAIIAGDGDIPIQLIDECIKQKREYLILVIIGHGSELMKKYNSDFDFSLSKIGKAIKFARSKDVTDVIMVGSIRRPSLINMIPDLWTAKFLTKLKSKMQGDNSILSLLAKELELEGFNILAPEDILPKLLCPKGSISKLKPNSQQKKDILKGFEIAKQLGKFDIGQSLVIQNGLVLAVEGAEGTDKMILRSKALKKEDKGAIFVKVIKPNQDERVDRPVIGIDTIKSIDKAGIDGIAVEGNAVFILNNEEVIKYANNKKLFIVGV